MPTHGPADAAQAASILTIGHSTRSAEAFLDLLAANDVTGLADIRTIPQSRRHPHFGRASLELALPPRGVEYRHFAALGGLRKPRADSPNGAWRNPSFRGYADHMQTAEFASAVDQLLEFAATRAVAIMCAEAVWWRCHRMLVSDALVARGVRVEHIMSESGRLSRQPHRLTPFAQVHPSATRTSDRIWYPGLL